MNKLLGTLWELIDMAELDAQKTLRDGHTLSMADWFIKNPEESFCRVCLAGAVILNTLGYQATVVEVEFCDLRLLFGESEANKLYALDCLRAGELRNSVDAFYKGASSPHVSLFNDLLNIPSTSRLFGEISESRLNKFFETAAIKAFRAKLKELDI